MQQNKNVTNKSLKIPEVVRRGTDNNDQKKNENETMIYKALMIKQPEPHYKPWDELRWISSLINIY